MLAVLCGVEDTHPKSLGVEVGVCESLGEALPSEVPEVVAEAVLVSVAAGVMVCVTEAEVL